MSMAVFKGEQDGTAASFPTVEIFKNKNINSAGDKLMIKILGNLIRGQFGK